MAKTITGGIVSTNPNERKSPLASPVENILFKDLAANTATPPINAVGVMILKNSYENIVKGNTLYYQDGNSNNNATFTVLSAKGPLKFDVKRIS